MRRVAESIVEAAQSSAQIVNKAISSEVSTSGEVLVDGTSSLPNRALQGRASLDGVYGLLYLGGGIPASISARCFLAYSWPLAAACAAAAVQPASLTGFFRLVYSSPTAAAGEQAPLG